MSCCDYNDCNQGRDCPVRSHTIQPAQPGVARVAVARPVHTRPMYTRCDVLGVCQADTECVSHCQLWTGQLLADQTLDAAFERTDRRLGLLLTGVLVLLGASIVLGMATVYAPLIAAALDWLLATVQLGLYRWAGAWS